MRLWRDNRIDGEYEISIDEILDKFLSSQVFTEPARNFEFALIWFVTQPEGLNSSFDADDREKYRKELDLVIDRAVERDILRAWIDGQPR